MENKIKVLTLWPLWAVLHAHGVKRDETRPKATSHRGPYLIHSSQKFPKKARELCGQEPFKSELAKLGYTSWRDLPTAAIVGSVEYTQCFNIQNEDVYKACWNVKNPDCPHEIAFGDYAAGRWVWFGKNHTPFKTPIPYKNGQGYYRNFDIRKLTNKLNDHNRAFRSINEIGGELREVTSRQIEEIYQQAKERIGENSAIPKVLEIASMLAPEDKHIGVIGNPAFSFLDMLPLHERPLVHEPPQQQAFEFKAPKPLPPIALPSIISKSMTRKQNRRAKAGKDKFSKKKYHSLTSK